MYMEKENLIIREAEMNDAASVGLLYYETISSINKKDYSPEQISVWVSGYDNIEIWKRKIEEQYFFIAETDNCIAGFGSVTDEGYLDFMFTHKDHQRRGVASAIYGKIEDKAKELNIGKIWAKVSITARPFFKKMGFEVTKIYMKKAGDVEFEDSIMEKVLNNDI